MRLVLTQKRGRNLYAFSRKDPGLKASQLPNLKVHLYKQILLSVKLCHTAETPEAEIRSLIGNCQLLYNKCLYTQSMRMLDKAKRMAQEFEQPVLYLDILGIEKTLLNQTGSAGLKKLVVENVRETRKITRVIRNINTFSNLSVKLYSYYVEMGFIRNQSDLDLVAEFFTRSLPRYEEEKLGFHELSYLYCCFSQYYYFIQDFEKVLAYSQKWVTLFEEEKSRIAGNPEMYIRSMNYLLMALNKQNMYFEFQECLRKLAAIKRNQTFAHTENINLVLFRTIYVHEINRHFMLGQFKAGTRIVSKLEIELNAFIPKLDSHYVLIFYYKIACLFFGSGEYKRCIFWLNRIVNHPENTIRVDIGSFARILLLISHYELGNDDLLEYQVKSTYRFLMKNGNLGEYQKVILGFIRKLTRINGNTVIATEFRKLRLALLKLKEDPISQKAFVYFDILSWLESKIEKRPVQEIIQEKMRLLTEYKK
jgi:hypothetical protein